MGKQVEMTKIPKSLDSEAFEHNYEAPIIIKGKEVEDKEFSDTMKLLTTTHLR
jgi:hypothetical protein